MSGLLKLMSPEIRGEMAIVESGLWVADLPYLRVGCDQLCVLCTEECPEPHCIVSESSRRVETHSSEYFDTSLQGCHESLVVKLSKVSESTVYSPMDCVFSTVLPLIGYSYSWNACVRYSQALELS